MEIEWYEGADTDLMFQLYLSKIEKGIVGMNIHLYLLISKLL